LVEVKRISLVRPTIETPFHIDFDWWQHNDRDWRVYLQSFLCLDHQRAFGNMDFTATVDWVDPQTAEVQRVEGLQHILITHCAKLPSFITHQTSLVDAVFRLLLANGNNPMTPAELGMYLGRDATTILKTLSGTRVYKGLRPCPGC
jgi:hypothetical protein